MPLTEKVCFNATLQRGNRLQVPRVVRWRFKLENDQVLKISVHCLGVSLIDEHFYATMSKDGRIVVPKLILSVFSGSTKTLYGYPFRVIIEPS